MSIYGAETEPSIYGNDGLGFRQPGSMYYAQFTPGLYEPAPDIFGLGELSTNARWGLGILSAGAFFAGLVLPFLTMKDAPMPASMKKLFRTQVQWKEFRTSSMVGGTILGIAGLIGIMTALETPKTPTVVAPPAAPPPKG